MKKIQVTTKDRIFIMFFPATIAIICIFIMNKYHLSMIKEANTGIEFLKILIELWGIIFGFILTAVSVLATITGDEFTKRLRKSKHYKSILFAYCISSVMILSAIFYSIVIIFINTWNHGIEEVTVFFVIYTMISTFICIYLLFALLFTIDRK